MAKKLNFDLHKHALVPKHAKCSDAEKKKILKHYQISVYDLPYIRKSDAALAEIDVKAGDVIKISRTSPTAGEAVYYRCVINE
ncbi:MAG: DNA-directed RNA polymerase subunit H [Nanoarchaeota archaeon]|nr:DNA-directed RNA polymerase subunit H [Nanoarchaeota archaeon]